jgi:FG-GAP repeat
MHSLFAQRTAGLALAALTVALLPVLAGCGGGEIDSDGGTASSQGESGLDGRAQALSAGTFTLDTALTESAAVFAPAAGITEAQKFGAPNGMAGDLFGLSVAAFGSRVVVGAPQQNIDFRFTNDQGTAYVFDASGSLLRELRAFSGGQRQSHRGRLPGRR